MVPMFMVMLMRFSVMMFLVVMLMRFFMMMLMGLSVMMFLVVMLMRFFVMMTMESLITGGDLLRGVGIMPVPRINKGPDPADPAAFIPGKVQLPSRKSQLA
jgi:hypothetical protein